MSMMGMKVLVVDDEAHISRQMATTLMSKGYEVELSRELPIEFPYHMYGIRNTYNDPDPICELRDEENRDKKHYLRSGIPGPTGHPLKHRKNRKIIRASKQKNRRK
jgi:hypothetical protein